MKRRARKKINIQSIINKDNTWFMTHGCSKRKRKEENRRLPRAVYRER
jgi:hypothetical protein